MKKKSIILILVLLALVVAASVYLIKSHNSDADEETDDIEVYDPDDLTEGDDDELIERDEGNGISYDEEADGAVVETVAHDTSDFMGDWEAISDMANYLYGGISLTIKEDGTWDGVFTGEPLNGTWEENDKGLHMNNEIFSFDLAFSDSGKLILIDTDSDDVINTVLTRPAE